MSLAVGNVVAGRYRIEALLGEGGMGAVYRATQLGLKRDVALKVILPERASKERSRKTFLREARTAAALKHPNVVDIYDYGDDGGMLFIAMEMLNGSSLRDHVDHDLPPLSVERAVWVAAQIADVLCASGKVPLVHRDLKPENVVLDQGLDGQERAVVVDFGLAFVAHDADDETGRLTREGAVTGTPDYMSPEQCRGLRDLTIAADVYALGAILYEMLTAHPPFEGAPAIVISRHLFVKPKKIREAHDVLVPGALEDLVHAMLAKKPEDRPSPEQVRDALRNLQPNAPERMSGKSPSTGRAARMVSQHPTTQAGPPRAAAAGARVAWIGTPDDKTLMVLAANGLDVQSCTLASEAVDVDAIYAPSASLEMVASLVQSGSPVVADAPVGDVDRLTALLRIGASDVVTLPSPSDDLARKLVRVIRKAKRTR